MWMCVLQSQQQQDDTYIINVFTKCRNIRKNCDSRSTGDSHDMNNGSVYALSQHAQHQDPEPEPDAVMTCIIYSIWRTMSWNLKLQ